MADFSLNFEVIYTLDTRNIERYTHVGQQIRYDVLQRFEEEDFELLKLNVQVYK